MADGRSTASHVAAGAETTHHLPRTVAETAVREELERILCSHEFRTSRRCQAFLRYVVENTLAGKADQIKERTIGIDVFDRPPHYDPSDDATVRVKAGEVRKRLGLYYAGDGKEDDVHIELPAGTYIPEFRSVIRERATLPVLDIPISNIKDIHGASRFGNWKWLGAAGVGILSAVAVLWFVSRPAVSQRSVVQEFWAPLLQQSETPVVLSAAYVPVYAIGHAPTPEDPARVGDFTLLTDQFVGGGDLLAIASLTKMLNRMHRQYEVKIGTEVSFSDLRTSPTVLVGYSYTRWKEISKELRFFIDADKRPLMVTDNGKPTGWALPDLPPDKHTNQDFAIVSRVFHPDTRTMLVEIAGITQYGTSAAADLVSTPDLLNDALKGAPQGWEKKNLQLVLHTKVISGVAAGQKVVASYFW